MKINRSITEPIRINMSTNQLWKSYDKGIILSWENGRRMALSNPKLVQDVLDGVLPSLGWKGGINMTLKDGNESSPLYKYKLGSYHYLAQIQGLRNDNLSIDYSSRLSLVCSRTHITIEFTDDLNLLSNDIQVSQNSFLERSCLVDFTSNDGSNQGKLQF